MNTDCADIGFDTDAVAAAVAVVARVNNTNEIVRKVAVVGRRVAVAVAVAWHRDCSRRKHCIDNVGCFEVVPRARIRTRNSVEDICRHCWVGDGYCNVCWIDDDWHWLG